MTCLCDQIYFVDKTWQLFNWKINNNNKQQQQQQKRQRRHKQILSTNNYRDCSNVSISNLKTCYTSTFSAINIHSLHYTHTHVTYTSMWECGCGCCVSCWWHVHWALLQLNILRTHTFEWIYSSGNCFLVGLFRYTKRTINSMKVEILQAYSGFIQQKIAEARQN